jgi:hypothetical protein
MNHYKKRYENEVAKLKTYKDYLKEAEDKRKESFKRKCLILSISLVVLAFIIYVIWFFFLSEL